MNLLALTVLMSLTSLVTAPATELTVPVDPDTGEPKVDITTWFKKPSDSSATYYRECDDSDSDKCCAKIGEKIHGKAYTDIKKKREYRSMYARKVGNGAIFDCEHWNLDLAATWVIQNNPLRVSNVLMKCKTPKQIVVGKEDGQYVQKEGYKQWFLNTKAECLEMEDGKLPADNIFARLAAQAEKDDDDEPEEQPSTSRQPVTPPVTRQPSRSIPQQPSRSMPQPRPQQQRPIEDDFPSFDFEDARGGHGSQDPYGRQDAYGGNAGHGGHGGFDDDFDISSLNFEDVPRSHGGGHGTNDGWEAYDPSQFQDVPKSRGHGGGGGGNDDADMERAIQESIRLHEEARQKARIRAQEEEEEEEMQRMIAASIETARWERFRSQAPVTAAEMRCVEVDLSQVHGLTFHEGINHFDHGSSSGSRSHP